MQLNKHIHIHTHAHTHTHTYTHTYTQTHTYIHAHTHVYIRTHAHTLHTSTINLCAMYVVCLREYCVVNVYECVVCTCVCA